MIKYPIYVTVDINILDAANFDFNEKSTLQILVNYVNTQMGLKDKCTKVLVDLD